MTSCSAETWFNDARDVTDEEARPMCSNPILSLTFVALSIMTSSFPYFKLVLNFVILTGLFTVQNFCKIDHFSAEKHTAFTEPSDVCKVILKYLQLPEADTLTSEMPWR